MMPANIKIIKTMKNRNSDEFNQEKKECLRNGYTEKDIDKMIITQDDRIGVLKDMKINDNTTFYEFFKNYAEESSRHNVDLLYGLCEIYEDYKQPFHADNYPNITDRYLRISSIEGEGSYFYDKKTDAVYDVDWGDMDDFMSGKLKPIFTSFYAFLEWYYSEEG